MSRALLLCLAYFLGFAVGIISFTVFTSIFLGEGINNKTVVSLLLASILVCIQVFWK